MWRSPVLVLIAAVALHIICYSFCRIHQTLITTPAMAAGVPDRLGDLGDPVDVRTVPEQHCQAGHVAPTKVLQERTYNPFGGNCVGDKKSITAEPSDAFCILLSCKANKQLEGAVAMCYCMITTARLSGLMGWPT
jgi:hypothetical protein